jgi:molybdate-binding protein
VAAIVASERAEIGFAVRKATEKAGLYFGERVSDRVDFIAAKSGSEMEGIKELSSLQFEYITFQFSHLIIISVL